MQRTAADGKRGKVRRRYVFNLQCQARPPAAPQTVQTVTVQAAALKRALRGGGGCCGGRAGQPTQVRFPVTPWSGDTTSDRRTVAAREQSLRGWLERVLNQADDAGSLLRSPELHAALGLRRDAQDQLETIAETRARVVADAARAEQQLAAEESGWQLADALAAQCDAAGPQQPLLFEHQIVLELRNVRNGFWGSRTVAGPGGRNWYKVTAPTPAGSGGLFGNRQTVVTNLAGRPLLLLVERFSWADFKIELHRVDPAAKSSVALCAVRRVLASDHARETFDVEPLHPCAEQLSCTGSWDQLSLYLGASISAGPASTSRPSCHLVATAAQGTVAVAPDRRRLCVVPGFDVLLALGVTMAATQCHLAAAAERRTRRGNCVAPLFL